MYILGRCWLLFSSPRLILKQQGMIFESHSTVFHPLQRLSTDLFYQPREGMRQKEGNWGYFGAMYLTRLQKTVIDENTHIWPETKLQESGTAILFRFEASFGDMWGLRKSKIKTGAEAGELRPPASGCYYMCIMRNRKGGGVLSLHLSTP